MNREPFPSKMKTEATAAQADVPELELIKQAQAGDTEAFDQLVGRFRMRVFGMIYNMVHNEQDAWDLAQDSFVKAWKSIARFRGKSSFYTWLYRIVMNVTIDWLRKKQVKVGGTEFDDNVQLREIDPASKTVPRAEPLPHQRMERREVRTRIDQAIAQLSPEHRAVILMKETEDMQYHEIAEALDCSICTVMVCRERTPASQSQYLTQILESRVDPIVSPNATITMFEKKDDHVTVLWVDGLQSLPPEYAAK